MIHPRPTLRSPMIGVGRSVCGALQATKSCDTGTNAIGSLDRCGWETGRRRHDQYAKRVPVGVSRTAMIPMHCFSFSVGNGCFAGDYCKVMSPIFDAGKPVSVARNFDDDLDGDEMCTRFASLVIPTLIDDREVTLGGRICE
ncbi:MAG: hypothetical protein ABJ327_03365 [Litoreibacter sp.]